MNIFHESEYIDRRKNKSKNRRIYFLLLLLFLLVISVLSLTENTHRDKSLAGFSIYACGVRYVLAHSICLLRKRGIYLISNWCVATIYRVRAKREHIEFIFREHISRKWIYRQKKKRARTEVFSPLILALFCLYKGLGLAHVCVWLVKCDACTLLKV